MSVSTINGTPTAAYTPPAQDPGARPAAHKPHHHHHKPPANDDATSSASGTATAAPGGGANQLDVTA